jgi:hypothetical protein
MFLVIVKTQIQIMVLGPRLSAPSLIELKKKKKYNLAGTLVQYVSFTVR